MSLCFVEVALSRLGAPILQQVGKLLLIFRSGALSRQMAEIILEHRSLLSELCEGRPWSCSRAHLLASQEAILTREQGRTRTPPPPHTHTRARTKCSNNKKWQRWRGVRWVWPWQLLTPVHFRLLLSGPNGTKQSRGGAPPGRDPNRWGQSAASGAPARWEQGPRPHFPT